MKLKTRKLVYYSGLISTMTISFFTLDKYKFEKDVYNHESYDDNHDANIIAHRGFSSLEVENSYNAVNKGLLCNCSDGVEIDVRLTKDNIVVLSHDPYVLGIGEIKNENYYDIKDKARGNNNLTKISLLKGYVIGKDSKLIYHRYLSTKDNQEHLSTLDEILNIDSEKILLIDIKFNDKNDEIFMDKIYDVLKSYDGCFNIMLQSSNYDKLLSMMKKYPNFDYQLIIVKKKQLKYLDSDFNNFCIRKNLITKDIIASLYKQNKKVQIWTINSYDDYYELEDRIGEYINDVYIITDYPDEICYLHNKNKKSKLLIK